MATSSVAVAHMEWRKMNKEELREALASRGLATNGLRPLLIQRLESSVKALAAAEALANGKAHNPKVEASEEETSNQRESEKAASRLQQDDTTTSDTNQDGKFQDTKEVQDETTASVMNQDDTTTSDMNQEEKLQDTKDVQVPSTVCGAGGDKFVCKPDGTEGSVATCTTADNEKSVAGPLSDLEKKRLRAKKFGVGLEVTEQEKLAIRAERFCGAQSKKSSSEQKPEAEKRKERAARFGIVDEESRKKARQERFASTSKQASAEEEKRKARAARFGTATEQGVPKEK